MEFLRPTLLGLRGMSSFDDDDIQAVDGQSGEDQAEEGVHESQEAGNEGPVDEMGDKSSAEKQPSSSFAKVYDPEHSKKLRKLSSAQMQEKEIKDRNERQAAFLGFIKKSAQETDDDDGDSDFARMICKQMRSV